MELGHDRVRRPPIARDRENVLVRARIHFRVRAQVLPVEQFAHERLRLVAQVEAVHGDAVAAHRLQAGGKSDQRRVHLGAADAGGSSTWQGSQLLCDRGADPMIEDRIYHGSALSWAEHFGQTAVRDYLRSRGFARPEDGPD
jgi:hypothetical protein